MRLLLLILDPEGVKLRSRPRLRRRLYTKLGPNYVWHVDSYDTLKQYGICINGAIDGYSRCIIWLEANTTSSDPKVIAGYYIDAVRELHGTPSRLIWEQKMAMLRKCRSFCEALIWMNMHVPVI